MQIRLGPCLTLSVMLTSAAALATACGGGDSGGGAAGTGGSSVGGSNATGGQGGGAGAGGSTSGGGGSSGASGAAGAAGSGGAAGATGTGGTGGAAPMCSTSAECKEADVSIPGSTTAPTPTATSCVGGQCGLVTSYSGAYKTPKSPRSCTEICAASTYDGKAMECSASCQKKTVNGFGDQSLVFDDGADAGPGSVAGLVTYQFSPLSGGYKFIEVGCAEVPKSKYIQGSNSYTYVNHLCCCVAP